jgi:omega-hydroxy-beta-dihydromenaquinone-9 sulfotransferase
MMKTLILILLSPFVLVQAIINHACLLLDEVFYPSYKYAKVKQPVFIVGMTRTASSWLHKTLYCDRERFTSMKLWEMIFAPSIIQKKGVILIHKLNKLTGGWITGVLRPIDRYLFRGFQVSHPTSLFEIEEDDLVLIQILSNTMLAFIFPRFQSVRDLPWFDDRLSERRRRRIMRFYRACILRHMFVFGEDRTYLSKSPCHTPKIRSIRQIFPDSRFICTYRHPTQTIPSSISLFLRFFSIFKTRHRPEKVVEFTLKLADHWYAYPMKNFADWPEADYVVLEFTRLVIHPEQVIQEVYSLFGYAMPDDYRQRLAAIGDQSRAYKSTHRYSASDFMLRDEDLAERYAMPA